MERCPLAAGPMAEVDLRIIRDASIAGDGDFAWSWLVPQTWLAHCPGALLLALQPGTKGDGYRWKREMVVTAYAGASERRSVRWSGKAVLATLDIARGIILHVKC